MCRLVTGHKATALQEVRCFCFHGQSLGFVVLNLRHGAEDTAQQTPAASRARFYRI